ncbi:MAG: hypothetical protein IIZ27_07900 [Solobacterium sp.]|nr:hypothetical protein [Solobacterium sp.]
MKSIQFVLSPAAGKVLIAKGLASDEKIRQAVNEHTVVIVKGTTNAYLAAELLAGIGEEFDMHGFFRGVVKDPQVKLNYPVQEKDIIIRQGKLCPEDDVYTVAEELGENDYAFKGANAVDLKTREAGVLIGNPTSGTMVPLMAAAVGRRVKLIHPVGVEKRVEESIHSLARLCNNTEGTGLRFYPSAGQAYTEIDALKDLFGVEAHILSAGGVGGYEGCTYFQCTGEEEALEKCQALIREIQSEPVYEL